VAREMVDFLSAVPHEVKAATLCSTEVSQAAWTEPVLYGSAQSTTRLHLRISASRVRLCSQPGQNTLEGRRSTDVQDMRKA